MPQKPKEPNPGTQEAKILAYIRQRGSITGREAFNLIGQARIGQVIMRLRNLGHPIDAKWEKSVSKKTGKKVRYVRYFLATADYVRPTKPKGAPRPRPHLDHHEEPRKGTQAAFVLDYLRLHGSLTFDVAYVTFGIAQLAKPIQCLRDKGWEIDTRHRGLRKRIASIYTLINNPKHNTQNTTH